MAKVLFVQPNIGWQWDALLDATAVNQVPLHLANTAIEAEEIIGRLCPEVVVCALNFSDGEWRRILQQAQAASLPTNVIVVSEHDDIPLYLKAMEDGAYDFATLQTSKTDLARILRCALGDSENRRQARWKAATCGSPFLPLSLP